MSFGFSYVGAVFLLLLLIPNLLWTKCRPAGYETYIKRDSRALLLLERVGEVLVSGISLVCTGLNWRPPSLWSGWLGAALALMALYEVYWVRYFHSARTMEDFYGSLLGVPVAGAVLPVAAFFCLGIYGKNLFLLAGVAVLGVGHIGIHLGHRRELLAEKAAEERNARP